MPIFAFWNIIFFSTLPELYWILKLISFSSYAFMIFVSTIRRVVFFVIQIVTFCFISQLIFIWTFYLTSSVLLNFFTLLSVISIIFNVFWLMIPFSFFSFTHAFFSLFTTVFFTFLSFFIQLVFAVILNFFLFEPKTIIVFFFFPIGWPYFSLLFLFASWFNFIFAAIICVHFLVHLLLS